MTNKNIKEEVRRLLEYLPDDATWEDLIETIRRHREIETSLEESSSGRLQRLGEVCDSFPLNDE